jgi:carboxylesterase 2
MGLPTWRPNLDGYVFTSTYGESLRNNSHMDILILTGNNKDESGTSPDLSYNAIEYHDLYTDLFSDLANEFFKLEPGQNTT